MAAAVDLRRRVLAEAVGTALLLATVIGSCIMGETLAGGNVGIANFMFDKPVLFMSTHERSGMPQLVSEFVATFGLLDVIWGCARRRPSSVPFAVGAYNVPGFVAVQLAGAATATVLFRWLTPSLPAVAKSVVVPHGEEDVDS
jgi:glycerol uptake facilitator-like aquaporin